MNDYMKAKGSALDKILEYLDERSTNKLKPKSIEVEVIGGPKSIGDILSDKDPLGRKNKLNPDDMAEELDESPEEEDMEMKSDPEKDNIMDKLGSADESSEDMSPEDMELLKRIYSKLE